MHSGGLSICIVGPGALGCLFGAYLARAGHRVTMLARRPEHALELADRGILVREPDGAEFRVRVPATADPQAAGPQDLIIVLVKAYDTAGAAAAIAKIVTAGTTVLTLQNGLGNLECLASRLPAGLLLGGATGQGSSLLAPGVVYHAGSGGTQIGEDPFGEPCGAEAGGAEAGVPESGAPGVPGAARIAAVLSAAGLPAVAAPGVRGIIWGKLLVNAGINALTALLKVPNGELLRIPPAAEVMRAAVAEAEAVARALGVALPYPNAWAQVVNVARQTAANRSSMLQDIERGRRTEVGQINGAVAEAGRALGIPAPVNETLARLVKCLEPAGPAGGSVLA